ncbi:hypothetical protein K491DRAFT_684989 [Lophiostoma macrostomum CBS 122681]|uniref:Zn(2)-C6 fungal-type domain-containing protein n=1 Tax=Lophiostoma macrostomum CBS 122681 TaxID=1314788 RepID=A0A6A6SJN8_9PLEO|nr:hypothetical protein K491DRAFT_684989 [Lophiostoma macrostomum CBS 122681]
MPPLASRKGRRIASRACDTCRDQRVQCVFENESTSCQRCMRSNGACTFLRERKPRGPPAKRHVATLTLPVGNLAIEHLCARHVFLGIIHDYLEMVYPVLPLIHRPTFRALIGSSAYDSDPKFFRLCIALCAATVASIPRKFKTYSGGRYNDVGDFVDRACHLVLLSRVATESAWQNRPSMHSMVVSIFLAMAAHYSGRPNQGWGYASEAIHFFRALELFRKEGYEGLTVLEQELCKRSFWVLYIIQIHDRLSFIVPHTGLSFDPLHTDWEYLLPSVIEDEDLTDDYRATTERIRNSPNFDKPDPIPVISGFVALIRVFLCVADIFSNGFPGSPPKAYAMTSGTLGTQLPNASVELSILNIGTTTSRSSLNLNALLRIIRRLQNTLEELPEQLKISNLDPRLRSPEAHPATSSSVPHQFDIMRANIHITSLYIQSTILETCSTSFVESSLGASAASPEDDPSSSPKPTPRTQLWEFRGSIARELLEVLNFCSSRILEANGSSMIVKIREIAATLLDHDDVEVTCELEEQSRQYVAQFANILAGLDHMGPATIIPPIFAAY